MNEESKTPRFLEENAILVSLEIGKWGARKSDNLMAGELADRKRANAEMISVSKRLMPSDALWPVSNVAANARAYFKKHTVAWNDEGARLLPISQYDEFSTTMGKYELAYSDAKKKVLSEYEYNKQRAESDLGDLYDDSEYPHKDDVAELIYMNVKFTPIVTGYHLVAMLGEEQLESLREKLDEESKQRARDASISLYDRLEQAINLVKEKMNDDNERGIRQSVLDSLSEVADVVTMLNFMNDDNLNHACASVRGLLENVKADELRPKGKDYNPEKAKSLDEELERMREQMSGAF